MNLGKRGWLAVAAALAVSGAPVPPLALAASAALVIKMSECPNGMSVAEDAHFRVFACKHQAGAAADEKTVLAELDSLWEPETKLMGNPVPDHQAPGENGRIDTYLTARGQTLERGVWTIDLVKRGLVGTAPWDPYHPNALTSSGFMVVLRPEDQPKNLLKATLAHEFFHVLQYSHNTALSCLNFWFLDASATWAEWHFVPSSAEVSAYQSFRLFQSEPGQSLFDSAKRQPDADWMWPLFMQQHAGSPAPIAAAWKAMRGKKGCDALNGAISAQVPFSHYFGDFAVENFDSQLQNVITKKKSWVNGFGPDYPAFSEAVNPAAGKIAELVPSHHTYNNGGDVNVNLPPLSARYDEVTLPPVPFPLGNGGERVLDFSGLAPAGHLWVSVLAADYQKNGFAVHNGTWQRIDLTGGTDKIAICLNADATRKNEQLGSDFWVILANRSWGPDAKTIKGSYGISYGPAVCASKLAGTLKFHVKTTDTTDPMQQEESTTDATMNLQLLDQGGPIWLIQGGSWSEDYQATYTCPLGGSDTVTASGSGGPLTTGDLAPAHADLYANLYASPPYLPGGLLGESMHGTDTGPCAPTTPPLVGADIQGGCPHTSPGFSGAYTAADRGIDFGCHDAWTECDPTCGLSIDMTVTGVLTATDPVDCGLWTRNCAVTRP